MLEHFTKRMARFGRDEHGSVTVEAVLWFPVFVFFLVMLADAAMIFSNQSRIMRMVHDGARAYSMGGITSCAELEDWIEARVRTMAPSANAFCDTTTVPGVAIARVRLPSGELDLSGVTGMFGGLTIEIESQHMIGT